VIGDHLGIKYENIIAGVGSDEIIDLLIRIFCTPGSDEVIIFEPTYGMYQVACEINDVKVNTILMNEDYQIDDQNIESGSLDKVKIIFICSPNNPTGNLINEETILSLCRKSNAIVVLDEAYIDFCEEKSLINRIYDIPNLVVIRTFSKAWGLAGVRCGYCAANKVIVDLLLKIKAPYNINSLTEQSILNAVANSKIKNEFVKLILIERDYLISELSKINSIKKIFSTDSNFVLFKIDNASVIQKKLAEKKIIIRDRSNQPLLENCLRVSVGTRKENELFISELKRVI
jgi:histidinol-phosphate aminotransferase